MYMKYDHCNGMTPLHTMTDKSCLWSY